MDLLNETARIWVENHPTLGWCAARVDGVDDDGNYIAVDEEGQQFKVPQDKATSVDPSCLKGVQDLLTLGDFNEGCLLQNIRLRYFEDKIYTGIGAPILVSLNPYQKLTTLYSPETMAEYRRLSSVRKQNRDLSVAPHLFSVASECYDTMLEERLNQSIIITGESGAGKTEATKRILNYVANIQTPASATATSAGTTAASSPAVGSSASSSSTGGGPASSSSKRSIEDQVLKSNPILEAFGNAKTVRNDNSSRFGKFIEIQFDAQGKLRTANIRNYLLEKCRITAQQANERNYHAFYFLLAGAPEKLLAQLHLTSESVPEDFDFVSVCSVIEGAEFSDEEEFLNVQDCLHRLKFSKDEIETLWKCCAAVLLLGNVDFLETPVDGSEDNVEIADHESVCPPICDLLGIQVDALRGVLRSKKFYDPISKAMFTSPLRVEQAKQVKLSIARTLYSRMFDWIVSRINSSMQEENKAQGTSNSGGAATPSGGNPSAAGRASATGSSSSTGRGAAARQAAQDASGHKVGLLDIYGFEVFEWNSFEQLCINFANEKLQQHFNSHMFRMEQKLYTEENINWNHITWLDNQEVIDALEKKPNGVFPHLDSTCLGPNATDAAFLQALYTKPAKPNIIYNPSKQKTDLFGVAHYAGEVLYSVDGFLDKNYEKQTDEALEILRESKNDLIKKFMEFSSSGTAGGADNSSSSAATSSAGASRSSTAGRGSVGMRGSRSMTSGARGSASATDKIKGPQGTVSSTFREQLDALVADLNKTHPRYIRCIKPNANKAAHDFDSIDVLRQLRCAGMLEAIRIRRAGYSVRRPFREFLMKYGRLHAQLKVKGASEADHKGLCTKLLEYLETKLNTKEKIGEHSWQIGRSKVFLKEDLQKLLESELNAVITEFCVRISKMYRGYACRSKYRKQRKAAVDIQAFCKCLLAVRRCQAELQKKRAATKLQAKARGWKERRIFSKTKKSILQVQTRWRGVLVRIHLGDFRTLKDKRDAERARQKIQRQQEDAERKALQEKVREQELQLEESKKQATLEAEERIKKEAEQREKLEKEKQLAADRKRQEQEQAAAAKLLEEKKAFEEQEAQRKREFEKEREKLKQEQAKLREERSAAEKETGSTIRQLQGEVTRLQADLEFSQETSEKYRKDAAMYREEMEKAADVATTNSKKQQEELKDVRRQLVDLRDQVRTLDDEKQRKTEEAANAQLMLEAKETELQLSSTELRKLTQEQGSKEQRITELEDELTQQSNSADDKVRDLERALEEAKFNNETLERSKKTLQELCSTNADESRSRIADLEAAVRKLKNEIDDANKARDDMQIELEFNQKKLEDLREKLLAQATAPTAAKQDTTTVTTGSGGKSSPENDESRPTIANHMEFLAMLEKDKKSIEVGEVVLEEEDGTPASAASGTTDQAMLRKQLQERNRKLAEHHAAYTDLKAEYDIKREENRRYVNELAQLRNGKAQLEMKLSGMVSGDEMKALRAEKTDLDAANARLTFSVTNLEKQKAFCETKIEKLEEEIEEKRKANKELANKLQLAQLKMANSEADAASPSETGPHGSSSSSATHQDALTERADRAERGYQEMKKVNQQFREQLELQMKDLRTKNEELRAVRLEKIRLQRDTEEAQAELQGAQEERDKLEGTNKYYLAKVNEQREELSKIRQENKMMQNERLSEKLEYEKKSLLVDQLKARNEELVLETSQRGTDILAKTLGGGT
ncbi:unnamed protein product [Amoebophrya sp. A120]|nr:unnamed protein product [Amoebophrya sp. A120]|eukprot:GSA120T00012952001.1